MCEPDFSGVEPTRVAEARRRIAAIEEYMALERPSGNETIEAAASLGLSQWAFRRLVTAWRNYRDPAMIVRSKTGPSKRDYGIDERIKRIAIEEIRKVGFEADVGNVAPAIEAECRAIGVTAPSRPTIFNYIVAERRMGSLRYNGPPCFMIGRLWFHLPLRNGSNFLPCALVVVSMPERIIAASSVSVNTEVPPSIENVLRDLLVGGTKGGQGRKLLIEAADKRVGYDVLEEFALDQIAPCRQSTQRLLARAFGDRLGSLVAVYRPGAALAKPTYTMGRHDAPLSEAEALSAIERAIAENNRKRGLLKPYAIL